MRKGALRGAVRDGNVEKVCKLLDDSRELAQKDIDDTDKSGFTTLMYAVFYGGESSVRLLRVLWWKYQECGCNMRQVLLKKDGYEDNVLMYAIIHGNRRTLDQVIEFYQEEFGRKNEFKEHVHPTIDWSRVRADIENKKRVLRKAFYDDADTAHEWRLKAGTATAASKNNSTVAHVTPTTVASAANQAYQRILRRTDDGGKDDSTSSVNDQPTKDGPAQHNATRDSDEPKAKKTKRNRSSTATEAAVPVKTESADLPTVIYMFSEDEEEKKMAATTDGDVTEVEKLRRELVAKEKEIEELRKELIASKKDNKSLKKTIQGMTAATQAMQEMIQDDDEGS